MPSKPAPQTLALLIVLALLLVTAPAAAEDDAARDRIDLVCTEQPVRHVAFGDAGQVTYEELPPKEQEPVHISVIRSDTGKRYVIDEARIESDRPYLNVDRAAWTHGEQIDAEQGRIRLNLKNYVLTVVETGTDGQANFRRFQCKEPEQTAD
jgi:hypothetical protein